MTSPNLNVDHEELIQLADGHVVLIDELGGGRPPQIKGEWPSAAAAQAALGAAGIGRATMASRLGANADNLRASGETLGRQDHDSGVDMAKTIGPFLALAGQSEQAVSGFAGAAFQAFGYPASGLISGLTGPIGAAAMNANKPSDHPPAPNSPGAVLTPEYHEEPGGVNSLPGPRVGHHLAETHEQMR